MQLWVGFFLLYYSGNQHERYKLNVWAKSWIRRLSVQWINVGPVPGTLTREKSFLPDRKPCQISQGKCNFEMKSWVKFSSKVWTLLMWLQNKGINACLYAITLLHIRLVLIVLLHWLTEKLPDWHPNIDFSFCSND